MWNVDFRSDDIIILTAATDHDLIQGQIWARMRLRPTAQDVKEIAVYCFMTAKILGSYCSYRLSSFTRGSEEFDDWAFEKQQLTIHNDDAKPWEECLPEEIELGRQLGHWLIGNIPTNQQLGIRTTFRSPADSWNNQAVA